MSSPVVSASGLRRVWLRRITAWSSAVFCLLGAGGVLFYARDPLLARRLLTYPREGVATDLSWYAPTEIVPGGADRDPAAQALHEAAPEALGLDEALLEQAAAWAGERQTCALIVARRGRIALERYWGEGGRDVPMQSFSLAKTVLGLLVGLALEDGTFQSLHESAARYLTEWADDPRSAITIDHLLLMVSGIENDVRLWNPFSAMVRTHLSSNLESVVLGLPLAAPPGERFEYTNFASQALGIALMRASSTRYAAYLSERLWIPLGASDARVWLDRDGGMAKTYCCLFATARDWLRVGELLRNGGRAGGVQIVPESWVAAMIEPHRLTTRYGRHVWLQPGIQLAQEEGGGTLSWFWLDGKDYQRVYVIPSLEAVIVRIGQGMPDGVPWDETFLPRIVARAARQGGSS